jgi:glycerate-2-kinase
MSKARIADELRTLFATAVRSADPHAVLLEQLPEKPSGRCIVVGAGRPARRWLPRWRWHGRMSRCMAWW